MNSSNPGTAFLKEFKDFVAFLQNLWGILAGISVLFPLSNVFLKIIPLEILDEDGLLVFFSPRLFTTIATLVSLFLILWTFSQRSKIKLSKGRAKTQRRAWLSFGIGISSLVIYIVIYFLISNIAYDVLGWESDDVRRLFSEVVLLIFYCLFFSLITRAFMLLGMIEFFRLNEKL